MPDQSGELISLAGLRGKHVVLYFYPKADTRRNKRHNRTVRSA